MEPTVIVTVPARLAEDIARTLWRVLEVADDQHLAPPGLIDALDSLALDLHNAGIMLDGCVVCVQCACSKNETGMPVTIESHPDGYTCDDCGKTVHGKGGAL
jgi:hypothetical protein